MTPSQYVRYNKRFNLVFTNHRREVIIFANKGFKEKHYGFVKKMRAS